MLSDDLAAAFVAFQKWLLTSRMSFHGFDLQLPWWFGLGCWNYALAGPLLLLTKPEWSRNYRFPISLMAYNLIFIQAPLSFLADYLYMSEDSYWHVADRLFACPGVIFEMSKFFLMIQDCVGAKQRKLEKATFAFLYIASFTGALVAFGRSQDAQKRLDRDGFILWHHLWHM